jgi:ABC-2 type transport system permease protein
MTTNDVLKGRSIRPPRHAFATLLISELRLAWRVPIGFGMGLGFPILLLVVFGLIPGSAAPIAGLHGISFFATEVPVLIGISLLVLGSISLPRTIVTYRELGILRRFSTTPLPRSWILAAQLIINGILGIVTLVLIVGIGTSTFHLPAPQNLLLFVLASLATMTALLSIGMIIAAVAPSQAVASGISGVMFFVMLFFAGLWLPIQVMPPLLRTISLWTPLGASTAAMDVGLFGPTAAIPASPQYLLTLIGYTIIFSFLAIRYFRWK